MSQTNQPAPGGTTPTPGTRLSLARLRRWRLERLKAKCADEKERREVKAERRRVKFESREEFRRAKAASRAERDEIARKAKLQRVEDKAAKKELQRKGREPLDGLRGDRLLLIIDSPRRTLACLCVFGIPAILAGVAVYFFGVQAGHVEMSIVLGSAGATSAVMAARIGALGFFGRRDRKKAAEGDSAEGESADGSEE